MSENYISIRDQGYTSPDFLTNVNHHPMKLFRKPLYSPLSLTTLHSEKSLHDHPTSPNKENETTTSLRSIESLGSQPLRSSNSKILRASSFMEEEKINNKKYKIFFKTFLHGKIPEQEISSIWEQLQDSLTNPYAFDRLIEETKAQRDKEAQDELINQNKITNKNIKACLKICRYHSLPSQEHQKTQIRCSSLQKIKQQALKSKAQKQVQTKRREEEMRKTISLQVSEIKTLIFRGVHEIYKK